MADPYIGRVLKQRFRIVERLGQGGMSTVYKAVDELAGPSRARDPYVAVKIMHPGHEDAPETFAMLQRETERAQSLAHPNIVRVHGCDRDGDAVFMTMEYLAGEPLKRLLRRGGAGLPKHEVLRIVDEVGAALSFAHRHGVVHGDLKPGNVIIAPSGGVKVIDFGIARVVPEVSGPLGTTPSDSGILTALTPPYASPEMLEDKEADPRDDVYALACVAYRALTGVHPFGGEPATIARDAGLRPAPHPRLSRREHRALAAALEFDRYRRTPTIGRLLRELRQPAADGLRKIAALAARLIRTGSLAGISYLPF
jgi:eukaryotic-like serine/threonine-protein kinase